MSAAAPKVFISYRRQGTAMHAGRLYDAMAARFGDHNVFMDLEMAPGVDFVERITTAVGACRALLVVIGPEWIGTSDGTASGAQRLADPDDFVRLEVETALRVADVTVIPVLVAGARMPDSDELPESLRPLARRNAIELSDLRWRYDCGRLMSALDELLGEQAPRVTSAYSVTPPAPPSRALLPLWIEGVAVAVGAGMLARALGDPIRAAAGAKELTVALTLVARRAEVWAVVGGALALWLSVRRGGQRRLFSRVILGLLIGALAGALGGAVLAAATYLPDPNASALVQQRISIGSLAITGGILGAAVGTLWIPRRVGAGLAGGALGGALVQLGTDTLGFPGPVLAVGLQCLLIVGVALGAMLAVDVRTATATTPAVAASPAGAQ
jgi:hypothetical protein